MAYQPELTPIVPNTNCYILRSVPLDDSYQNSMTFKTEQEQHDYFKSKAKYLKTDLTPIYSGNKIRFPKNEMKLIDCNYIMYQNPEFGDKWFYAFITDIHGVNINMSEITFEIDVIQTWLFKMHFRESYIERCHVTNDNIGANTETEGLELGEFIINKTWKAPYLSTDFDTDWGIGVLSTYTASGGAAFGQIWADVYSGLNLTVFSQTQVQDLNNWLDQLNNEGKLDGVVAIYMVPTKFYVHSAKVKTYINGIEGNLSTIDGYAPRNKKLLTYPYNFLYVSNSAGNGNTIKWERWIPQDGSYTYELSGDVFPSATYMWAPKFYKSTDSVNVNEAITVTGLPQCAWISDTYRAWLAQNQSSLNLGTAMAGLQTIGGAAGFAAGAMTGNLKLAATSTGMLSSGVSSVANILAKKTDSKAAPDSARGNQVNNIIYATGHFGFKMYAMSITSEIARTIDDYFDMYGYAVNRVRTPRLHTRSSWNYIKTNGLNVYGNIGIKDIKKIKSIFDNGITFWHDDQIGNYNRSNEIL